MTSNRGGGNARAVSDIAATILDPVLRKRAGMSLSLVQSWQEIAGERLAGSTRPERILWPRRRHEDDPFEPATLIVACEGAMALRLQHEATELLQRVNGYFGFAAVARLKIVQKPVAPPRRARTLPPLPDEATRNRIARTVGQIEDEGLRAALERLGHSVAAKRRTGRE